MISHLRPYPAYKESGIKWLGKVPEHWATRRLKSVAELIMGQSPLSDDCSPETVGLPFLQGCAEFGYMNPKAVQFCSSPPKSSPSGAILMSVRAPVGRLNVADQTYGIGRGLCALLPLSGLLRGRFALYQLHVSIHGLATLATGTTYDAVTVNDIGILPVWLPSLNEQAAVVHFLDHVDRRIRRYIRAKKKLIKLLEEQKQVIIQRAVTRGLDPCVRLRTSGVGWLGDIPDHWDARRNAQLFVQRNENGFADLPILEVSLKTGVRIRVFENSNRKQVMSDRGKYKRAAKGDIAYNMMRMWQGAVGVAPVDGLVSPAYVVARPLNGVEARYYDYLFHTPAYMGEVDNWSRGIVKDRNRLYWQDFKQISSPSPPPAEQERIADYLEARTGLLSSEIISLQREIFLLREYCTRLIADVVTGKLDVREAAARLPDEAGEPEPIEEEVLPEEVEEDVETTQAVED